MKIIATRKRHVAKLLRSNGQFSWLRVTETDHNNKSCKTDICYVCYSLVVINIKQFSKYRCVAKIYPRGDKTEYDNFR